MKHSKTLFLICFLYACFSFANQQQEKILLVNLITEIESKFDVKFSYAVEDVQEVWVNTPNDGFTLPEMVAYLNKVTSLKFNFLNQRYITVTAIQKKIDVCGKLISFNTKEPVIGASVLLEKTNNGVVSNIHGEFTMSNINSNDLLIISYLGHHPKTILAKELQNCEVIELIEKTEQLNQVIITRFLTTGLQQRIDGSTVLNTKIMGALPGLTDPDVLQSIQALPGVESVDESIANINVRGGSNDQNLMIWDGIKMYHAGHFFGLISAYNPYLTDKVVVTKNGTSSEFSDGVSSTINMFTKNNIGNQISGGAGLNLLHADAFLEIPIHKKMALHISGRRSFTDMFTSATYQNYFERSFQDSELTNQTSVDESSKTSDFYFYDYTAKLLYNIHKNHQLSAQVIGIYNNLDYTESDVNTQNETTFKTNNLQQKNLGSGLQWQAQWSKKFKTDVNVFLSKYNVDAVDYRVSTDQKLTQANEVLETGVKINTHYKLNSQVSLLQGYQFNEIGILNETTVNIPSYQKRKKDVLLNHALYSEVEFNNGNTYLRAGLRANYFQKFNKLIIEPRLSFRQKLNAQFALNLLGEFKNQSATQIIDFQDNFLGVEKRRWILADDQNIPIAQSKQSSLGVEFHQNNWVVSTEGFYKKVAGITASNQGFYNKFQYVSATGDYHVKGAEFLINKTTDNFSIWLSYTYSINQYKFDDFSPSEFPNNVDVRHSASLAFSYQILKNLEWSMGGIFRSGQPYTQPVTNQETIEDGNNTVVNYDVPNDENLPNFIRLDSSLKYHFQLSKKVKSSLTLGILNLLNKENIINRYYVVNQNNDELATEVNHTSLGFTPNISFRVHF